MFDILNLPEDIQNKIFNIYLSDSDIDEIEKQIINIENFIKIVQINKPDIMAYKRLQYKYDMIRVEPKYYLKDEFNKQLYDDDDEFNEEFFIDFIIERQHNLYQVLIEERAYIRSLFE